MGSAQKSCISHSRGKQIRWNFIATFIFGQTRKWCLCSYVFLNGALDKKGIPRTPLPLSVCLLGNGGCQPWERLLEGFLLFFGGNR